MTKPRAKKLASVVARHRNWLKIAGCGIAFVSLEDESGVANAVILPDIFQRERMTIVGGPWLLVEEPIQNVDISIHAVARKITMRGNGKCFARFPLT